MKSKSRDKIMKFRQTLSEALIERDEAVDVVCCGLLCKEHVLLLGMPGTAKTMLSVALCQFLAVKQFPYTLNKFTDPGEFFGPINLSVIKERNERRVEGYAPTTVIMLYDEVFKGSSAILNCNLTLMNERKFKYGTQEIDCPLQMLIGLSNEYPNEDNGGRELGALADRFLFKLNVEYIRSTGGRQRLLWEKNLEPEITETLTLKELAQAQFEVGEVTWSETAMVRMEELIVALNNEHIFPGDRRLRKSVKAVQAFAYLSGADEVNTEHLEICQHLLWNSPEDDEPKKCQKIVLKCANPVGMMVADALDKAEDVIRKNPPFKAVEKLKDIRGEIEKLLGTHPKKDAAIKSLNKQISVLSRRAIGAPERE